MERKEYPILEHDPARDAMIEPSKVVRGAGIPKRCVMCFFQEAIASFAAEVQATAVDGLRSEAGTHPIYEFQRDGERVALFHPGVGAPLSAGFLEEAIQKGGRKFVVCGGAGILDERLRFEMLAVVSSAVRDEGTSYHYLPPAREVEADASAVRTIEEVLKGHGVPFVAGKTWTTDALYRETRAKVDLRRSEGCIAVEMEAAALLAVAKFRGVPLGYVLYGGDDLTGEEWDPRTGHKRKALRRRMLEMSVEACLGM